MRGPKSFKKTRKISFHRHLLNANRIYHCLPTGFGCIRRVGAFPCGGTHPYIVDYVLFKNLQSIYGMVRVSTKVPKPPRPGT